MIITGLNAKSDSMGYERLRDVALVGREVSGTRWALSLFMGRGFFVWLKTSIKIEETNPDARSYDGTNANDHMEEITLPDAFQGRMVTVLASMVLGALREEVV